VSYKARWETEAAMCADFSAWVLGQGWTPYPETAGWDLLLVGSDGTQVGIHAKLRLNLWVMAQAIPDHWDAWSDEGPDFRAVLVPNTPIGHRICGALGLCVFQPTLSGGFSPKLGGGGGSSQGWHYWNPKRRHRLPEYVPDVAAGAPAPVRLTDWKIKALRICAVLEIRGSVTRDDFKRYGVDHRRWTGPGGWLGAGDEPGAWRWRVGARGFAADHPVVYPKILDEVRSELAR